MAAGFIMSVGILEEKRPPEAEKSPDFWLFLAGLVAACAGLGLLVALAPPSEHFDLPWRWASLRDPSTIPHLQRALRSYAEKNSIYLATLLAYAYVLMQAFAVPGAVLLSLVAGAIWGFWALPFVVLCSTVGACLCFCMSKRVLRDWLLARFRARLQSVSARIQGDSGHFWTLLCLRLNPFVPNALLNLACPLVGVSLKSFAGATLLGIIPLNLMQVSAGRALRPGAGRSQMLWLLGCSLLPALARLPRREAVSLRNAQLLLPKKL